MYEMAKLFFGSKGSSNLDRSILIFFISFDLLINTAPRFEFDDSPIHAHLGPCKCSLYKQGHLTQKRQKIAVYCNNQCAGLSLFCNIISVWVTKWIMPIIESQISQLELQMFIWCILCHCYQHCSLMFLFAETANMFVVLVLVYYSVFNFVHSYFLIVQVIRNVF